MNALKSGGEAGVLQFKHVVVHRWFGLEAVELVKEANAAYPFAKEAAEHAVSQPLGPILVRDILDDIIGGCADDIFGRLCLFRRDSRRADSLVEKVDRQGDLLH